jgi:hypothetical protein
LAEDACCPGVDRWQQGEKPEFSKGSTLAIDSVQTSSQSALLHQKYKLARSIDLCMVLCHFNYFRIPELCDIALSSYGTRPLNKLSTLENGLSMPVGNQMRITVQEPSLFQSICSILDLTSAEWNANVQNKDAFEMGVDDLHLKVPSIEKSEFIWGLIPEISRCWRLNLTKPVF